MATYRNIHDHSDIVKRPYHKSTKHHWMSAQERAAQFAPFSALGGHKEIISDIEAAGVACCTELIIEGIILLTIISVKNNKRHNL